MAINKKINVNDGSGRKFEDVTTSEVTYDTTPQLGSFNPVTSDGVAKAISGASGEVPVVNPGDEGKVLTAGFDGSTPTVSWQNAAASYTAGSGISISNENVISSTVKEASAGNGIAVSQEGAVSVYHDDTLTDVGGRRNVDFVANGDFHYIEGYYNWYVGSMTVPLNFDEYDPTDFFPQVYFSMPSDGYIGSIYGPDPSLAGKQAVAIVSKPGDITKYRVVRLRNSDNGQDAMFAENGKLYPVNGYGYFFYIDSESYYSTGISNWRELIVDGKVTFAIGLRDSATGDLLTVSDGRVGPAYNGSVLSSYTIAHCIGAPSAEYPPTNWTYDYTSWRGPIYDVRGSGVAQLSVSNPVPSVDGQTGKVLKAGSNGPEWGTVPDELPAYTSSENGKVLGVVDNSGTAELQWVAQQGGGDQPLPAIPAYSLRFQFSDTSFDPTTPLAVTNGTWSLVDAGSGIWDFTYTYSDWTDLFNGIITLSNVPNGTVDIIGGNMSGVSTAIRLFKDCNNLRNVRIVSPWGDGNTDPDLSYMLERSSAVEIYLDLSGSNFVNGNPHLSYMAHECSSLKKFTLENPGSYPWFDHILHDCFALHEATIEGFEEISNAEAMFTGDYNLVKITLTPTQTVIKVNDSAESMFYNTGYAVETIGYPFDLTACYTARGMFAQCKIRQLPVLLNTRGVGNFSSFCDGAPELRSIPYIDVTNAYDVEQMFYGCSKVQTGALDTYTRLSQLATPPSTTTGCFTNCGVDTASGKIELAKIPTSYGGLGYESASTASVTLSVNDLVVSDSVDVTSITVDSGVTSGIVQWTVASTTTLPTVTDGTNPLKASVNNPASLTVGRTVQVSILNGTWVVAEFA